MNALIAERIVSSGITGGNSSDADRWRSNSLTSKDWALEGAGFESNSIELVNGSRERKNLPRRMRVFSRRRLGWTAGLQDVSGIYLP